jgi:hypothetical protein
VAIEPHSFALGLVIGAAFVGVIVMAALAELLNERGR